MYGEVLAFSLSKERPRAEVKLLASSEELAAEAERTRPHLVVANRVPPAAKASSFWVEVTALRGSTRLGAEISANGYSRSVADVRIADVIAALDQAEEELLAGRDPAIEAAGGFVTDRPMVGDDASVPLAPSAHFR
jgi:hypothetical protein